MAGIQLNHTFPLRGDCGQGEGEIANYFPFTDQELIAPQIISAGRMTWRADARLTSRGRWLGNPFGQPGSEQAFNEKRFAHLHSIDRQADRPTRLHRLLVSNNWPALWCSLTMSGLLTKISTAEARLESGSRCSSRSSSHSGSWCDWTGQI